MHKTAPHNFPHYIKIERHGESPLGVLSVASVPFEIKRVYWISDVGDLAHWSVLRGGHAHHRCMQVFYCLKGRVEISCDNGRGRYLVRSIDARVPEALFVPSMSWHTMTYRKGSICMAVASEPYDEKEYIRSRKEFDQLVAKELIWPGVDLKQTMPRAMDEFEPLANACSKCGAPPLVVCHDERGGVELMHEHRRA